MSNLEKLIKSYNGQWTLVKAGMPEKGMPWTDVHFSDGSRKGFPYRHQAMLHLTSNDYHPHGESKDNVQHFYNSKDPSKTAKLVHHPAYGRADDSKNRRISDIK